MKLSSGLPVVKIRPPYPPLAPSGEPGPQSDHDPRSVPVRRPYSRPQIIDRCTFAVLLGASPGIGDSLDPFTRRSPESSRYYPQPPRR